MNYHSLLWRLQKAGRVIPNPPARRAPSAHSSEERRVKDNAPCLKPLLLTLLLLLPSLSPALRAASTPPKPNILWIIAEDIGPDLACYGNKDARTPNLDRLAGESRLYRNAYATAPICSASRSAFNTGRYQTSFGAHHHRSHRKDGFKRPPDVRLISERLREAGYFTANVRELPPEVGFTSGGKTDWNFQETGKEFDSKKWSELKPRQPFYAQVNIGNVHRPYNRDKSVRPPTDPATVTLPPYLADDPVIRADWAAYFDDITLLDAKVGAILQQLDRDGLRENTVVFFFGDNGREDFRGKYHSYDQGFRVPLMVRWPALLPAGSESDDPVSLLDVHANSLALAGVKAEGLDGWPFFGPGAKRREYIFAARDRIDETPDRVRMIRDARYRYMRNFEPERPYLQPMEYADVTNPTHVRMQELFAAGKLTPAQAKFMAARRPAEELYDLRADPFEMKNLADDPRHRATLERFRATLDTWMKETGDQGATPEDPRILRDYIEDPGRRKYLEELRTKLGVKAPARLPAPKQP